MEESNLVLFFGRFHPLVVHLPIGFLLLAGLFEVAERFSWVKGLKSAVSFALLLGTLSAVVACVLGFMLSSSGDYNDQMLSNHQWGGIVTTVVAGFVYLVQAGFITLQFIKEKAYWGLLALMVGGLSFTGHMGGNLTHGSDYLTYYMPFKPEVIDPLARPQVTDLAQAQLFGDLVHPIIQAKCKSCHNDEKRKGKLSFATIDDYLKGGKHGDLIVPGSASDSELIKRVTLDQDDEDFMPPDGKTPLTEEEVTILSFWIENASADFDTLLMATNTPDEVKEAAALWLDLGGHGGEQFQLAEVSPEQLASLREKGFVMRELVGGSGALDVSLPPGQSNKESIEGYIKALLPIQDNVIWLSMENSGLENDHLKLLNGFKNLRKLKIPKNPISNVEATALSELKELESINLYQTKITISSVEALAALPKLKTLYLWNTEVDSESLEEAKKKFEHLRLVSGA